MLPHSGPPLSVWQRAAQPRAAAAAAHAQQHSRAHTTTPATRGVVARLSWGEAHRRRLQQQLGASPAAETVIRLATHSLAPSTNGNYSKRWQQFQRYCERAQLQSLPATSSTCALFLAHLYTTGRIQPQSIQPYLSAINRVHRDVLGLTDGPAGGPLISDLRAGWEQDRADRGLQHDERVPLPADVALRALDAAYNALVHARGGPADDVVTLRALVYVAFGFQLMARSDTDANLLASDVNVTVDGLVTVRLRHEKGRRRKLERRVLRLPPNAHRRLGLIVALWGPRRAFAWRSANVAAPGSFWSLPGDRGASSSPSALCTAWLQHACTFLNVAPPPGAKWTSHSLRSGAASAANALAVPIPNIRYWGGWSRTSGVVMHYIDPLVLPSPGARAFFGWMAPSAAAAAPTAAAC